MNKLLMNAALRGRGATSKKKGRWRLTEEDVAKMR